MHWAAVVFGWPFVIVSIVAFAVALFQRSQRLMLLGAIFASPFCLYLSGSPRFGWLGATALLMNFLAVWAQARSRTVIAATLVVPFVVLVMVLAVGVWQQNQWQ